MLAGGTIAPRLRRSARLRSPWTRRAAGLAAPGFRWIAWLVTPRSRRIARLVGPRPRSAPGFVAPWPASASAARRVPPWGGGRLVAPRSRLSGRPGRVAIAPRRGVALGPCALGSVLLLESIARIFVGAAGPPVGTAPVAGELRLSPRRHLRLRGVPQLALSEPPHDDVLVRAFQLRERRQQLLPVARAKSRRLVIDEDGPVRKSGRHPVILAGIRDLRIRDSLETFQLFDQRRTFEVEEPGRLTFVPAGPL